MCSCYSFPRILVEFSFSQLRRKKCCQRLPARPLWWLCVEQIWAWILYNSYLCPLCNEGERTRAINKGLQNDPLSKNFREETMKGVVGDTKKRPLPSSSTKPSKRAKVAKGQQDEDQELVSTVTHHFHLSKVR